MAAKAIVSRSPPGSTLRCPPKPRHVRPRVTTLHPTAGPVGGHVKIPHRLPYTEIVPKCKKHSVTIQLGPNYLLAPASHPCRRVPGVDDKRAFAHNQLVVDL